MMGAQGMNGVTSPQPQVTTEAQAEAEAQAIRARTYTGNPIVIAPSTLKWAFALIMGVLAVMPNGFADRYLKPAAQSELDQWVKVVQVLQQGQKEIAETVRTVAVSVERVTLAVDNLAGQVSELKQVTRTLPVVRAAKPR